MKNYRTKDVRINAILWDNSPASNRAVKRLAKKHGERVTFEPNGRWIKFHKGEDWWRCASCPRYIFEFDGDITNMNKDWFEKVFEEDLRVRETPGGEK